MRSLPFLAAVAMVWLSTSGIAGAASACPPEVKEARTLLTAKTATAAKTTQPSKSLASARSQDVQAPRSQGVQAPRSQDVQAPRNVAKGRGAALANARKLVNEAETACKDADGQRAAANARAAMELLKYLP